MLFRSNDLYRLIFQEVGIPIVFDYHHHGFCTGEHTVQEALLLATSTWNGKPVVHYSESKALNEGLKVKLQAHSDYVFNKIDTYGLDVDVMIEAKAKESTVLKYKKDYLW